MLRRQIDETLGKPGLPYQSPRIPMVFRRNPLVDAYTLLAPVGLSTLMCYAFRKSPVTNILFVYGLSHGVSTLPI